MKPAPFATTHFPWKILNKDDFTCKIEDYHMRVEQIDVCHWWWRVYYKGEPILEQTNEFSTSKFRAIGNCEGLYMGHLRSNKQCT